MPQLPVLAIEEDTSQVMFLTTTPSYGPLPLGHVPMMLLGEVFVLPESLSHQQNLN